MDRRYFFKQTLGCLVAACIPNLFTPKLIKPAFRRTTDIRFGSMGALIMSNTQHPLNKRWNEQFPLPLLERDKKEIMENIVNPEHAAFIFKAVERGWPGDIGVEYEVRNDSGWLV